MIDADSKRATYVNPAYETVTGRSCQSLIEEPSSDEKVIHLDDRAHVLAKLEQAAQNGYFDEGFRILRPDAEIRWVAASLARANSSWAEAEALRKATLALTEDLH